MGLTQAQLAKKLGVSRQTVIRWESAPWVTKGVELQVIDLERSEASKLPDGWEIQAVKMSDGLVRCYVFRDENVTHAVDAELADLAVVGRNRFLQIELAVIQGELSRACG